MLREVEKAHKQHGFLIPTDRTPVLATPKEHWETWIGLLRDAKEFAGLWSMYLNKGHAVGAIVNSLKTAGVNGAIPYLSFDEISSVADSDITLVKNPFKLSQDAQDRNFARSAMFQGGTLQVHELRRGGLFKATFPSQGTDHRKGTITEEYAGMNTFNWIDDSILKTVDTGVTFSDGPTVGAYQRMFFDAFYGREWGFDYHIDVQPRRRMIVDVGNRNQSEIQGTINDMIDTAKDNFTFLGQFLPDPFTARRTERAAKKGIELNTYTVPEDHAKIQRGIKGWVSNRYKKQMSKYPNHTLHHHPDSYVHAKIFLKDIKVDAQGNVISGEGLIGSHNGVIYTQLFGTAEVAFHTTEPALLSQMYWFVQDFDNQPRTIKNYKLIESGLAVPDDARTAVV